MTIALSKEVRAEAVASLERWFAEHLDEAIGNVSAAALLAFFVDEIGPTIYNRGVADVQERLQARVMEVDIEVHEPEFPSGRRGGSGRKGR